MRAPKVYEPKRAEEELAVISHFWDQIDEGVWIGITDKAKEGYFAYTSDNMTLYPTDYTNWAVGQPMSQVDYSGQRPVLIQGHENDCTALQKLSQSWYNENCNEAEYNTICEINVGHC